jgi:hypothetical protein
MSNEEKILKEYLAGQLDQTLDRLDVEYEYARKCVLKAMSYLDDGDYAKCAYEVRSFPIEAEGAASKPLLDWATNY